MQREYATINLTPKMVKSDDRNVIFKIYYKDNYLAIIELA